MNNVGWTEVCVCVGGGGGISLQLLFCLFVSVLVWGDITCGRKTDRRVIHGYLNAQGYVDQVLRSVVVRFRYKTLKIFYFSLLYYSQLNNDFMIVNFQLIIQHRVAYLTMLFL